MNWLKTFFEESPGTGSATRLIAIGVFFCGVAVPALVWLIVSLHDIKPAEIPGSVIGFMAAAGTLAGGLFAYNKTQENKAP